MSDRSALLAGLCIALLAAAGSARADCTASGTGGTGYQGLQGSGAGGTGVRGGDTGTGGTGRGGDTGTGGTGVHDPAISGSGGTGVLGTITGFGSVCVNGLRVTYGDDVAVEVNGSVSGVAELAIGHVVRVRAVRRAGQLRATHIAAEAAVGGPIESFDAATGRLVIMGQSVEVMDSTRRLAPLRAGQRVSVSGLRRHDGVVSASRIEERSAQARDLVTGRATRATSSATYVGDVRASLGAAHEARSGERVQFEGTWNAERRSLVVAGSRPARVVGTGEDRLSLEGYVAREGGELRVHGVPVDVSPREAGGEARSSLEVGNRVRIEGEYRRGRLRVERLEFDRRSSRRERAEASDGSDRADREDREDRGDRSGRGDRSERPERTERPERAERPERPDRPERPERPDRSGRN